MSDQEYKDYLLKDWEKGKKELELNLEMALLMLEARDLKSMDDFIDDAKQAYKDIRVTTEELTSRFDIIFKN